MYLLRVSIHAPTRGATSTNQLVDTIKQFQSTHPLGVRQNGECDRYDLNGFNPRTHSGCDQTVFDFKVTNSLFQSTHPLGVRLISSNKRVSIRSFNPRTHSGCDQCSRHTCSVTQSFNPRTHSGCDSYLKVIADHSFVSIHAPTRGATATQLRIEKARLVSIHAPTRGATQII